MVLIVGESGEEEWDGGSRKAGGWSVHETSREGRTGGRKGGREGGWAGGAARI